MQVASLQCNFFTMLIELAQKLLDRLGIQFILLLILVGFVCSGQIGCKPVPNAEDLPVDVSHAGKAQGLAIRGLAPPVTGGFNSVVMFEPELTRDVPVPAEPTTMDQFGLAFDPGVLVARVGQVVAFTNGDDVLHNVHVRRSATLKTVFNVATPITGEYLHVFDAGTYTVSCDVHPAMGAYIVATEAPYAVVADREGRFELLNIPAGRYTVRVWNIDAGRRSERVVDIAGTEVIDLTVPE